MLAFSIVDSVTEDDIGIKSLITSLKDEGVQVIALDSSSTL